MAQQPTTFGSSSGYPGGQAPGYANVQTCTVGGNVICSGSPNFLTTELFFEPETPPESLKHSPPTWNELEQLLDNPYVYTWGHRCDDASGPIPGNEQGYPTYCTSDAFIRRPNFSGPNVPGGTIVLPRLLLHPLNYNPPTGAEMRGLNPNFAGLSNFLMAGTVIDPHTNTPVATGVCYIVGVSCTPFTTTVNVSSGASHDLAGERVIDYDTQIGRERGDICQTNPEPIPIRGGTAYSTGGLSQSTAFDSENLRLRPIPPPRSCLPLSSAQGNSTAPAAPPLDAC